MVEDCSLTILLYTFCTTLKYLINIDNLHETFECTIVLHCMLEELFYFGNNISP